MCSCYKVSVSRVTAGGSRGFRLNVSLYVFISSSDKHDLHFSTRFDSVLRWTHSSVILACCRRFTVGYSPPPLLRVNCGMKCQRDSVNTSGNKTEKSFNDQLCNFKELSISTHTYTICNPF